LSNVRVYSIAEKYGVLALKQKAKKKFKEAVSVGWNMDDFPRVISETYSSTPSNDRGLRDVVAEATHKHINALLKKENFRDVLEDSTGFAAEVTQLLASDRKKYKCPNCSN